LLSSIPRQLKMLPFEADIGFVPRMPWESLASGVPHKWRLRKRLRPVWPIFYEIFGNVNSMVRYSRSRKPIRIGNRTIFSGATKSSPLLAPCLLRTVQMHKATGRDYSVNTSGNSILGKSAEETCSVFTLVRIGRLVGP
jgi:hypothetical protein